MKTHKCGSLVWELGNYAQQHIKEPHFRIRIMIKYAVMFFSKFDMDTQDPINEHKYISENPSSQNEFLTEKQRRLIEYHFAVKRSLGFTESEHEEPSDPTALRRNSDTEVPADK